MKTKHLILLISFIFLVATGCYLTAPITWDGITFAFGIGLIVFGSTLYFGVKTKKHKKIYDWLNWKLMGEND